MSKLSNRGSPSARRRRSGHGPAPTRTSEVRATVLNGWDVRPTLDQANAHQRSRAQAAGSFVAGSPLPQALIQCRKQLTDDELRLRTLVILLWSARSLCQTTRRWPSPRWPLHWTRPRPSAPAITPHTSMRVEQRVCTRLSGRTSPVHLRWLRLPDQKWLCLPDRYHPTSTRLPRRMRAGLGPRLRLPFGRFHRSLARQGAEVPHEHSYVQPAPHATAFRPHEGHRVPWQPPPAAKPDTVNPSVRFEDGGAAGNSAPRRYAT